MAAKGKYHVYMDPAVHRKLRMKSAELGIPMGDVIAGYLEFVETALTVDDPAWVKRLRGIFKARLLECGAFYDGEPEAEKAFTAK